MKKLVYLILTGLLCMNISCITANDADQLIVVITQSWNDNHAILYRFEKDENTWRLASQGDSVSLGRAGLAWGIGLHKNLSEGPVKVEGDKKSPAGVFELGSIYGWDEQAPENVTYSYKNISALTRCVDDPKSQVYNTIVEETPQKDWNSAERMKIEDYRYLIVVKHNPENIPGKGSCIFLHLNNTPTTGCTAMNDDAMLSLMKWMSPKKKVLLVQLPIDVYTQVQTQWHLPKLPSL